MTRATVEHGSVSGVGFAEGADSRACGGEAARQALAGFEGAIPDLVLLFATDKHNPAELLSGVRSVVGEVPPIVGGRAVGVVTSDGIGLEGLQVGVAAIASPSLEVEILMEQDLPQREREAGERLGARIAALHPAAGDPLLLLLDTAGDALANPMLRELEPQLPVRPTVFGAGLVTGNGAASKFQFSGHGVTDRSALAVLLRGLRVHHMIMHGCRPASRYYTITKTDGVTVLELDGRPTLQVLGEVLDKGDLDWESYTLFLTLGINRGDPFGDYREQDYSIRQCMSVDLERGGLRMFGDDLVEGTRVQLMRREISLDEVRRRVQDFLASLDQDPLMLLYIDCAGRSAARCGMDREDASVVQEAVSGRAPLLGWHVACEIGSVAGSAESHNFTGILVALTECGSAASQPHPVR